MIPIIILFTLIIIFSILHIESKIPIFIGIGLLIGAAVLLAFGEPRLADQLANYSFYSLIIGFLVLLIDYLNIIPQKLSIRCRTFVVSTPIVIFSFLYDRLKNVQGALKLTLVYLRVRDRFAKLQAVLGSRLVYLPLVSLFNKILLIHNKNNFNFKLNFRKSLPVLLYAALSLIILGALLKPGFILTLDGIFSPHMSFNSLFFGLNQDTTTPSIPYLFTIQFLSNIIPAWILQKITLFFVFFLSGLGAHRLFSCHGAGSYFAGIFYAITPFIYVRFLAGQWGVLWAYALIPFAVKSFIDLLNRQNISNTIKVAIFSTLVGMLLLQGFLLLFLTFMVIFLVFIIQNVRHTKLWLNATKWVLFGSVLFIILNFYWIIPFFLPGNSILGQISPQDELLFAPQTSWGGRIMFDTAAMYGFWREGYIYAKDIFPFWWVLFLFILFIAIFGFVNRVSSNQTFVKDPDSSSNDNNQVSDFGLNKSNWLVISFGIIWIISLFLAIGAATPQTKPVFDWFWDHFSLLRGFRDSQKFVALLCLSYAFLGGVGVDEFIRWLKRFREMSPKIGLSALVVISLFTPLAYSFTIFSFHGQIGTTDYPRDWYEANDYLNKDQRDFSVLILPWHLYMDFSWLPNQDQRLANPAQQFFDKPVIQGDNLEMPGIYSQSVNPISKYIEFLLGNKENIDNFGELLAPLNVKYIILLREADYSEYSFLSHQGDISLTQEFPNLFIFENKYALSRVYGVDSIIHIRNLDDYLQLSREQDVMSHIYVLGEGTDLISSEETILPVGVNKKSPISYHVNSNSRKYFIFTVPQDVNINEWEYNYREPTLINLGLMPVFESSGEGDISYRRFKNIYLPAYIISGLALLTCVFFIVIKRIKRGD